MSIVGSPEYSLLMPGGKKTKKTCVFAGANVLGRRKRDYRSVLIYMIIIILIYR